MLYVSFADHHVHANPTLRRVRESAMQMPPTTKYIPCPCPHGQRPERSTQTIVEEGDSCSVFLWNIYTFVPACVGCHLRRQ
jgi:hypothetical protein